MGGGTNIISQSAVADASARELLAAAQVVLAAAYAKVTTGGEGLSQDDLVGEAVVAQQVQNSAWAIQTHRLAQASAASERGRDFTDAEDGGAEWFPLEVGARMGWSDRQAGARLGQACEVLDWTPGLVDLAGEGYLDARKVTAVANVTAGAPGHVAAEVEARVVAGDPKGVTSTKLAAKARRLLAKLAPVEADEAGEDRRRGYVGVFVSPHHEPGLAELTAVLPTLDAAKLMAAIDTHARELQEASTTSKTLPESRVDALTDLVLNGTFVDTHLTLLIPLNEPPAAPIDAAVPAPAPAAVPVPAPAVVPPVVPAGVPAGVGYEDPPGWSAQDELRWAQLFDENQQERARVAAQRAERPDPGPVKQFTSEEVLLEQFLTEPWPPPDDWFDEGSSPGELPVDPWGSPDPCRPPEPDVGVLLTDWHHRHGHDTAREARRAARGTGTITAPRPVSFEDVLLPRVGIIPGSTIQDLVQSLGVKLSRALADPVTGVIAETGDKTYRPGAALLRFVKARDQHCRFPGCTHPAARCDLDHVVRHPDGPTAAHNLQCLCRHHHRAKHQGGWTVSMTEDGVCTWTSPTGRTYITQPAD